MTKQEIISQIKFKKSFLCIGLDTDIEKIPKHLLKSKDPIFEFNKQIIDATKDLCIAYKPNTAFYESSGYKGFQSLEKTVDYIPKNSFKIADAKRGDIGNTANHYAKAFFESMGFDAITVAPYMGSDSVMPFLQYQGKWAIILALTSNEGAKDFQLNIIQHSTFNIQHLKLFEQVIHTSKNWGTTENTMFVVGATKAEMLQEIRKIIPEHFLLIPGVGAQGGSLKEVVRYGMNKDCGLIVSISRTIIYASDKPDFADKARAAALEIQKEMSGYLDKV